MPENKSIIFKTLQRARQTILYMKPHCGCNLQLSTIIDNVNCLLTVHGFANNTFGVWSVDILFLHSPLTMTRQVSEHFRCFESDSPAYTKRSYCLQPVNFAFLNRQLQLLSYNVFFFLITVFSSLFLFLHKVHCLHGFPFFYVGPSKYYFYGLQTNI